MKWPQVVTNPQRIIDAALRNVSAHHLSLTDHTLTGLVRSHQCPEPNGRQKKLATSGGEHSGAFSC